MIRDQHPLQVKVVPLGPILILLDGVELQKQTFLQVSRPYARRLQRLHQLQRLPELFDRQRNLRFVPDRLKIDPEIPLGIDVIDDRHARLPDPRRTLDKRPLPQQMLRQRDTTGGGVVHGVELFVALAVVAGGLAEVAAVGREFLVLEVFPDLGQPLEVLGLVGVLLDHQRPLSLGQLGSGLGGVVDHIRLGFPLAKFQNRVALQLLFNPLLQGHQRQLEDLHALDHPRREHLPLIHPHRCGLT